MKRQKFREDPKYVDLVELVRNNWSFQPYDFDERSLLDAANSLGNRSKSTTTQRSYKATSRRSSLPSQTSLWASHLESSLIPAPRQPTEQTAQLATAILARSPKRRFASAILPSMGAASCVIHSSASPSHRLANSLLAGVAPISPIIPWGATSRIIRTATPSRRTLRTGSTATSSRRTLQTRPSEWMKQLGSSLLPCTRKSSHISNISNISSIRKARAPSTLPLTFETCGRRLVNSPTLKTRFPSRRSISQAPRWITRVKSAIIPFPKKRKHSRQMQSRSSAKKHQLMDYIGTSCMARRSVHTQYEPFSRTSVCTNAYQNSSDDNDREQALEFDEQYNTAQPSSKCARKDPHQTFSVETLSVGSARSQNNPSMQSEMDQGISVVDLVHMAQLDSDGEEMDCEKAAVNNVGVAESTQSEKDQEIAMIKIVHKAQLDSDSDKVDCAEAAVSNANAGDNSEGVGTAENEREEADDDGGRVADLEGEAMEAVDADVEVEADTPTHSDEEAGGDGHHNNSSVIEFEITLTPGNYSNSDEDEDEYEVSL